MFLVKKVSRVHQPTRIFFWRRNMDTIKRLCSSLAVVLSSALDVLGMRISCDARWNDHIFRVTKEAFKCLGFWKRCRKYFTPSDLLAVYRSFIRPRMEYNSHIWAGASRCLLMTISNSIDSLERCRNMAYQYQYYSGRRYREVRCLISDNHIFLRSTCTSRRAHHFVVGCVVNRTMHYTENSYFARTARLWNDLSAKVFPVGDRFKLNLHKRYSLFLPSYNLLS